jgi:hypothetical protein
MAQRLNAEGDLTLTLMANGRRVHRLSFSWVDERFAGLAGLGAAGILPFIARNQGHRADEAAAVDAFRRAFPHHSPLVTTPGVFCCAALQGMAQALGMDHMVAVKSAWHCAYAPSDDKHFATAYDGFWRSLGGTGMPGRAWHIALPFGGRPLAEIPSRHRKRAALRRAYWQIIGEAAGTVLRAHLVQPGSTNDAYETPQFTENRFPTVNL